MIQTIVVVALLLAEVTLALFHYPYLLRVARLFPNAPGIGITHLALMTVLGAAFVLIGLVGLADRIIFVRRVRARLDERDSALHAMGEETLRMKAACYDQERPPLADIRTRLEAVEQSLRALLTYAEGGEGGTAMPDHERTQVPLGGHTA
jgi:hypothetical protein